MFKKIVIILSLTMISYPVMADDKTPLNTKADIKTNDDKAVWGEYVEDLEKKVNEAWKPEYGDKKSTTVLFKVKPDGTVCPAVTTMKSSGSKEYDEAAVQTIKSLPSFGNFPKGSDGEGKIFIMNLNNDYKPEVKEEAKEKKQEEQSVENKDEVKESVNNEKEKTPEIKEEEKKPEIKEEKKEPSKEETPETEQKKEEKPFVPKFSN